VDKSTETQELGDLDFFQENHYTNNYYLYEMGGRYEKTFENAS